MKFAYIFLAVAVLLAPAGWYGAQWLFWQGRSLSDNPDMIAMQERLNKLVLDLNDLQLVVEQLSSTGVSNNTDTITYSENAPVNNQSVDYTQIISLAGRRDVNEGLTNSSSSYLLGLFGKPREDLTQDCQPMTNPVLKDLIVTEDVGPIRVTMLRPAILSLKQIFNNIQQRQPDLYARISTAGSLCVRLIRGSTTSISNHAFGLAVDLNIDGQLDVLGDAQTQLGLSILADYFRAEGWYWGAGFGREDSMHFQVSREKIETWRRLGQIPGGVE